MSSSVRIPLAAKIVLIVAVISSLIIWIFFQLMVERQEQCLVDSAFRSANRLAETIRLTTYHDMLADRRDAVYLIMDTAGCQPGITRIRIFNKEGRITYSSFKTEVGRVVNKESEACYTCHQRDVPLTRLETDQQFRIFHEDRTGRILGVIKPIHNEPACSEAACHAHPPERALLGVIDVQMSLREMDEKLAAGRRYIFYFALFFMFIIPATAGVFIYRFVHRPVNDLTEATARVASGDLSYRIEPKSADEVGVLATSFNDMTAHLQQARQELQNWADTLEQRVADKSLQLQTAQDQIIQAEKMASMGRLAAVVAHEINNPLAGVLTYTKLIRKILARGDAPPEKRAEMLGFLEIMEKETARCGRIVQDLLAYARGGGSGFQPTQVNDILRSVINLVAYKLVNQQVEVELALDAQLPAIEANADKIQQAVLCLVTNAAEVMPDGGRLTVGSGLGADGRSVEIRVRDTGPGIPESIRGTLFEPFVSTKADGSNLGLGLYVAFGNIQRHGGTLTFETDAGTGTEFTITLPREQAKGDSGA
jgi:two-component system NtrC family sensor kinase